CRPSLSGLHLGIRPCPPQFKFGACEAPSAPSFIQPRVQLGQLKLVFGFRDFAFVDVLRAGPSRPDGRLSTFPALALSPLNSTRRHPIKLGSALPRFAGISCLNSHDESSGASQVTAPKGPGF